METFSSLLVDGTSIPINPDVAAELGINKAAIIQQVHHLCTISQKSRNHHNFIDGEWWVYNSYEEWRRDYFKWLSVARIKELFLELEQNEKLIIARQGLRDKNDRRKWYRVDYDQWRIFLSSIGGFSSHASEDFPPLYNGGFSADVYTENTYTDYIQRVKDSFAANAAPIFALYVKGNLDEFFLKERHELFYHAGKTKKGVAPKSLYASPFKVGKDGDPAQVAALYETYLLERPQAIDRLKELTGRAVIVDSEEQGRVLGRLWERFVLNGETIPGDPQPPSQRDLMYEILSIAYGSANGGYVGRLQRYYEGRTSAANDGEYHNFRVSALTPAETFGFVQWHIDQKINMSERPETLRRNIGKFRGLEDYPLYIAAAQAVVTRWEHDLIYRISADDWNENLRRDTPVYRKAKALADIYLLKTKSFQAIQLTDLMLGDALAIAQHPMNISLEEFGEYIDFIAQTGYFQDKGVPNIRQIGTKIVMYLDKKRNNTTQTPPPQFSGKPLNLTGGSSLLEKMRNAR